MDDIKEKLEPVFRSVFGDDDIELRPEMTAEDIDGWDSLTHINLVIAIEKALSIKFSTRDISTLKEDGKTIGDLFNTVRAKAI